MDEVMSEKARELGRLLGQTDEYKALDRARKRMAEDRELVSSLNRLAELEVQVAEALEQGHAPDDDVRDQYEALFSEMQASPIYQGLVAAQSNFDRTLGRVNDEIGRGIDAGAKSRIIMPG
jgi:cell fate (sporulation/competence/biofilm development) regulator YlbF (YheA/YmcA/DUF963 family)